jgi:hypothetical protein
MEVQVTNNALLETNMDELQQIMSEPGRGRQWAALRSVERQIEPKQIS